jgi:outer membrane biosynthesis protein TonB
MNRGKVVSGFVALGIYLGLIFLVLFFYNIHKTKAKNYVEKNSDRVTVTLVNSDKTVFNKSEKVSTPKKPTIPMIVPLVPLKRPTPKPIPKKVVRPKPKPKPIPRKVVRPKPKPKPIPRKVVKPKPKPKPVPKKTAKDLFSSVKTKDVTSRPVKRTPKPVVKRPVVPPKATSSIKHNSSMSDRIKSTHQSGSTSNANRDKGVKNAYIARVKRHMNNWPAGSAHKGKRVTIELTIQSSGKFYYKIVSGASGSMRSSLSEFLDRLNRMRQLGRHSKSTAYSIKVTFTVR